MNGNTGNKMFFTVNNWPRLKTACKNQEELESVLRKKILLLLYLLELSVLAETVRSNNNNRDTSISIRVSVNKHCCPLKCFIRFNFFFLLSWLFVKISSFLSLFQLLFSVLHESRFGVLKIPRVSNEYGVKE